jgi:hypothetical protein
MNLDDLEDHVWREMADVKKHAVGRWRINRLTRRCVKRWPEGDEPTMPTVELIEADEHKEVQMGIILTLILGAIIQEIVRILAAWYRENHKNKVLMMGFKKGLTP